MSSQTPQLDLWRSIPAHSRATLPRLEDADDPVVRRSDLDAFVSVFLGHVHLAAGVSTAAPTPETPVPFTTPDCSPDVKVR